MDHQYEWIFTPPEKSLVINMKNFKSDIKVFDATLSLQREKFNVMALIGSILRFPFITLSIVYRIHWQAAKLWFKKAPFFSHPKKIESKFKNGQ